MKTNCLQSDTLPPTTTTPIATLEDNLRLPRPRYLLENARQSAEQAARNQTAHLKFLEQLIASEVAFRHDKSVQRRIQDARFPVIKTMAGWDWNWPAKLNRMQLEHLLTLDFLGSCTNVILLGPTGIGKTHLATALGHTACLAGYSVLFTAAIDVVNPLSAAEPTLQLPPEITPS